MKIPMIVGKMLDMITPPIIGRVSHKLIMAIRRPLVGKRLANYEKLHLACGQNVLDGWANIDINSNRQIIGWNLTDRLPVRSATIELIFCEHFVEHVTLEEAKALLSDWYSVLQSGGILRLSTPNLKKVIDEYLSGRILEWYDVGWTPTTPCQLVNEGLRLWGHQFVYDAEELRRILEEAGFRQVTQVVWGESSHSELRNLEFRPFHGELIFECVK